MKNPYRNKAWLDYRNEVLDRDGFSCTRCGRSESDGAILQVHHKRYIPEKPPWEYPYHLCETLCKGCHAADHGIIRPEHGWEYVGEDDLGGLYGTCDRCGTSFRYAFYVQHPHWEPMTVGTVCCDDLTGTEIASNYRKEQDRIKRFLNSKRWKAAGTTLTIVQRSKEVRVVADNNSFHIEIDGIRGTHSYESTDDAKRRVFTFFESGEADEYFNRKAQQLLGKGSTPNGQNSTKKRFGSREPDRHSRMHQKERRPHNHLSNESV